MSFLFCLLELDSHRPRASCPSNVSQRFGGIGEAFFHQDISATLPLILPGVKSGLIFSTLLALSRPRFKMQQHIVNLLLLLLQAENLYTSCSVALITNYTHKHKIAQMTTGAISVIRRNSVSCEDCSD